MGTIKINNCSTLSDFAAVSRVGMFMMGNLNATLDTDLKEIIKIEKIKNTYYVTDIE